MRERVGVRETSSERVDRKVLKWFEHVERIGDKLLTKKGYKSEVGGERGVRRSRFRWKCWNRSEWRSETDKIL